MKLNIKEKKMLYVFGCENYRNTVARLKWVTALTVDAEAKRWFLELARKMEMEAVESWYPCFYHHLRMEMAGYFRAKQHLKVVEKSTDYEEDLYDEAV